jgi:thiol-disulfide isomerase/thioredoxin
MTPESIGRSCRRGALIVVVLALAAQTHGVAQAVGLVQSVRDSLARQDFADGERQLAEYKARRGVTPEWLEALSWMGRVARTAKQYERAEKYATETHELVLDALKTRQLEREPSLQTALGAAIEVEGHVLAETGARSEAVAFLQREADRYRTTPIGKRVHKDLNLVSLEGTQAPALDRSESLGPRSLSLDDVKGKVTLLFFWAHWCPDCKRQAPILSALLDKYRNQGFTIVAPTTRYGYITEGKDASPAEEKQQIIAVRKQYYSFLPEEWIQLAPANHIRYGVSTTPTLVLLDRAGIVRSYHPGNMTTEELEALIQRYLPTTTAALR